jgi:hypothetical protein
MSEYFEEHINPPGLGIVERYFESVNVLFQANDVWYIGYVSSYTSDFFMERHWYTYTPNGNNVEIKDVKYWTHLPELKRD